MGFQRLCRSGANYSCESSRARNARGEIRLPLLQSAHRSRRSTWYARDPFDDAYWAKQPPAVQQLREIDDMGERTQLAWALTAQGYSIDVPIMAWGWDAGKVTQLRQSYGYTWVPSGGQQPITAAPGLSGPGITPYDPAHPPVGSIKV